MCGAPERLPAFGARTFSTLITTSVVQDLNEKIAGVDCVETRFRIIVIFLSRVHYIGIT
jgi:hypothetical protein